MARGEGPALIAPSVHPSSAARGVTAVTDRRRQIDLYIPSVRNRGWRDDDMGAEVIAIEDSDAVGWAESAITIGEVNFNSAQTFVDNVLGDLGTRQMALLHVQVHGSPSGASFGTDHVSTRTFGSYRTLFGRLTPKFEAGSWVDLRACEVGQNLALLRQFQSLWNVGIVAGRGLQNNLLDANFGFYQIIDPHGREWQSFSVPPWVEYDVQRRATRAIVSRLGF
jgi:hypothetical protein